MPNKRRKIRIMKTWKFYTLKWIYITVLCIARLKSNYSIPHPHFLKLIENITQNVKIKNEIYHPIRIPTAITKSNQINFPSKIIWNKNERFATPNKRSDKQNIIKWMSVVLHLPCLFQLRKRRIRFYPFSSTID